MKKLHNRNKDIELYHKQKLEQKNNKKVETNAYCDNESGEDENPHELDIISEFKKREEKMT